jgi:transposase
VARDALLAMRTQLRSQRHALLRWPVVVEGVREHLDELLADLDRRVASLDGEIASVLAGSAWGESLACLTSAPGIGLVTAAWLLVGTLNFALCDGPESLAAYAGLAPVPRESGRSVRGRPSIGHDGNGRLRTALYMATLSAAQHNPAIKAFYARLRAGGKPLKVARCAAARKLLHLARALGSKQRRFDPHHRQHDQAAAPGLAA